MNENMDFVKTVKEMRDAQKEYFRTKKFSALEKSKALEGAVDRRIAILMSKQGNLF